MKISIEGAAKEWGQSHVSSSCAAKRRVAFGTAVKFDKQWRYYINPIRFEKWMTGRTWRKGLHNRLKKGG